LTLIGVLLSLAGGEGRKAMIVFLSLSAAQEGDVELQAVVNFSRWFIVLEVL
jgi:hypothetical protein